jgi:alpha-D-ribose 1-methylphosphonate 5-triphosphate diphosphatase
MNITTLSNAKLITEGAEFLGSITFNEGGIIDIDEGASVVNGAIDCEGDYVCPGLVELHTDNLERHLQPRPGVRWTSKAAILAHDRELASIGITTVFDALRVGSVLSDENTTGYVKYARETASNVLSLLSTNSLKISHFLHLRAEICTDTLPDELDEFGDDDRVGLVSLMDHTPGQRQFRNVEKLREYLKGKHGFSDEKIEEHFAERVELQARVGKKHRDIAVAFSRSVGAILASHDDTTVEDVKSSANVGVTVAEFPTTIEAAKACRIENQYIIMGAPNVVRGGSHSGNIAATELGDAELLDILSSDYIPASLLMGAVRLGLRKNDISAGIRLVTSAPADAAGLADRGRLEVGKRADIVRFRINDDMPIVGNVYAQGQQIA